LTVERVKTHHPKMEPEQRRPVETAESKSLAKAHAALAAGEPIVKWDYQVALIAAGKSGETELLETILNHAACCLGQTMDSEELEDGEKRAFQRVCKEGPTESVKTFLDRRPEISEECLEAGLWGATQGGRIASIELLIAAGACTKEPSLLNQNSSPTIRTLLLQQWPVQKLRAYLDENEGDPDLEWLGKQTDSEKTWAYVVPEGKEAIRKEYDLRIKALKKSLRKQNPGPDAPTI
jgi:hypothetical protein